MLAEAPKKEYHKRERRVRTTTNSIDSTQWLKEQYTDNDGKMGCQICKDEMPFKKRNGEYYFEKAEILSNDFLPLDIHRQWRWFKGGL